MPHVSENGSKEAHHHEKIVSMAMLRDRANSSSGKNNGDLNLGAQDSVLHKEDSVEHKDDSAVVEDAVWDTNWEYKRELDHR